VTGAPGAGTARGPAPGSACAGTGRGPSPGWVHAGTGRGHKNKGNGKIEKSSLEKLEIKGRPQEVTLALFLHILFQTNLLKHAEPFRLREGRFLGATSVPSL